MSTPVLPDYAAPFKPVPNVTPFTIRDGDTMLKKIDYINKYIRRVLIPWVNENMTNLGDEFETQVNILIAAVNAAIEEVIGSSVTIQDPIVAAMINNNASQTRIALNAILTAYYTKTAADALFETKTDANTKANARYTKTEADAKFQTIVQAAIDLGLLDGRLDVLEALTTGGGRLAQESLDIRYVKEFQNPVAVFIGSSNAEEVRGWVADICTRNGWIKKNYAVGGGGFTIAGAGNFYNQAVAAVADNSYVKANVKYVFVVDASNDTRAKANVSGTSNTLFAFLESNYPNARIIVIPEVFPLTNLNTSDTEVMRVVGRIYNQLRNTAASYTRVEIINNTWLWFWDNISWVGDTEAHLNAAGYSKLRWYVEQYVNNGIEHANDLGDNTGQVAGGSDVIHSRRVGGIVTTYGKFTLAADQTTSVEMARVNAGFAPIDAIPVIVTRKSDGLMRSFEHAKSGALNLQVSTPAGLWYYAVSHIVL